ncbi:MAG: choice-of-anchor J domain-containing protein, partial [Chitinophagaceae bacterium]|nr:choice-of-anchor J domain-containing protein [Chitinophagaceae bacterium]
MNTTNISLSSRRSLLSLLLLLLAFQGFGQAAATYIFSTANTTYTAITGGTVLSSGSGMDDASFSVTIPSFTFLGTAYTQAYASENGFIQFGSTSPTGGMRSGYLSTTDAAATTGVSAFCRDIRGKSGSELRTQTIGSEIIFQWTGMTNFGSTAQTYTFQIRLNTASNEVRVVYKELTVTSAFSTPNQVGLRGSLTDYNNRATTTSWAASTAGTSNAAAMTVSATVFPASGLAYIWNPPPPCSAKPVGGTLTSSAGTTVVCPEAPVNLTVTGSTFTTGIIYAWDVSTVSATGPWTPVAGATAASYTVTPPACANLYYRRRTICSLVGLFDSSNAVLVRSSCAVMPPYLENFESITAANAFPNCLTATNPGTMVTTYLNSTTNNRINHTPGGSKFAAFRWSANDFIYTPPIVLTAGKTYAFSFWYTTDGFSGWDSLYALSGSSKASLSTIGTPLTALTNMDYQKFTFTFVPTTSGEQIFAIKCKANATPWYLSIDDIALQEVPPCDGAPVTGMTSANPARICTTGEVDLDLPALPLAKGYTYEWQDSTAGSTWGNDISRPSFGGNKIPFRTGMISETTYFRCIVTCTYSGLKTISPVQKVLSGPSEVPYFEDFESITKANELPVCMSATSSSLVLSYTASDTRNRMNHTPGGSKFAAFRWGANDYLFSPALKFEGGSQYIISFWYITDGLSGWNTLGVKLGSAPAATSMSTSLKNISSPKNTTYQQYRDTFTAPSSGIYYFGIYCSASSAPWYLSFDDIGIQFRPCYSMPASGTISASVPSGAGVCAGQRTTLVTSGATTRSIGGIRYQWQRRDLYTPGAAWTAVTGADSNVLSADSLGGFEYRMAVVCTHSNDSSFTASYALPLLPAHPPIEINPMTTPVFFCLGDTVKLSATDYAGSIYDWMLSDSTIIPGWKFSDFAATEPGTYMVRASSPGLPCPAYTSQVTLNVNDPGYSVSLGVSSDTFICEGNTVALTGSGSKAGLSYQWTKNNVDIPGAKSTFFLARETGSYRIEAFDGVSLCPAASRSIRVEVRPNPAAVLRVPGGTTT